ncbi:NupC/NupG family nucleoside CNT transporter [Cobetia marina]|jgi:CNT family concentrative nucleoside transporter|uniref:Nucleoside permease n=1 Tax=Cobetia marina TaxID=28258 RepID=A0ABU9GIH6_COBMA|nr:MULTISPECIES: NupC/NupG family nucleoside CNT transporter [Cobetia]AOM02082.1 nucleoside transporter NupC [Cobetia marina]MDH2290618.1 NupC/NupG family nucleoside CNT transporter [Cobetia sp. 10Alg 146]MDH2372544.1 NupC/NupG family nucleoside CNT transporter [Cobetia sp. 3AK]MDI6003928.1 NupC/NupG family nucleoside CNT transporter [Cobetia pacifica]MDN2654959.1 NupC/NupG family nucleoside CNT transporter [Cobetia sp. 14N.309.X.WAT.E.A4]
MQIVMGLVGVLALLGIAFLLSENRRAISLRTVLGAFAIQALLGAFVLYVPAGKSMLLGLSEGVQAVMSSANVGMDFLFGGLVSDKMFEVFGGGGFVFALRVLPIIVFFSSLIAVLYHLRVMNVVISVLGGGLSKILGTSRPESLSAAANIFVGQTEAPLVVRPFIAGMTRSELFAVMTGGLASVAGSVLVGYASLGIDLKYLLAASFMAAPGGLLMAKMLIPETESKTQSVEEALGKDIDRPTNVIDAAASGAASGVQLAINVGGMLLAFIALIALGNIIIGWVSGLFGYQDITLQLLLGYAFAPVAWVIGVPWHEAIQAGSFIGQKLVLNEFVAFADLASHQIKLSEHSEAIIIFALCGFANLSSVAILMGGLGLMAPNRRSDIAQMGMKAILAGTLSNLMSASLAGLFLSL